MKRWIVRLSQIGTVVCYLVLSVSLILEVYSEYKKGEEVDAIFNYTLGILMVGVAIGVLLMGMAWHRTAKSKEEK